MASKTACSLRPYRTTFLNILTILRALPAQVRWFLSICLVGALASFSLGCGDSSQPSPPPNTIAKEEATKPPLRQGITFLQADQDRVFEPEKFTFSLGNENYVVSNVGGGTRIRSGQGSQDFRIKVDEGVIEKTFYFNHDNDLILVYELNDGESGWGSAVCLDQKTLKQKWLAEIPHFNIGKGLIEENFVYLTAIGFVAKLDLNSGRYIWRHDNLYKAGRYNSTGEREADFFNSFVQPQVERDVVLFQESEPYTGKSMTKRAPVILRINKYTGKRLD